MDEKFIKEQERRKKKRLGDQIYDVTAWSLPLLFDLEIVPGAVPMSVRTEPARCPRQVAATPLPAAKIGYLMPWGTAAAEVAIEALKAGVRIHTADEPFTHGGRKYPIGTAIVRRFGQRREPGRNAGADRPPAPRRGRADRRELDRRGHLARQQPGGDAESAARRDGVGCRPPRAGPPAGRASCSSGVSARR